MSLDPNVIAMLQTLFAGGGYQALPEYSATRGYLPFDSGTMGANINQLQDVAGLSGQGLAANPLVLAALGLANGSMFQMQDVVTDPGREDGRRMLENITMNTNPEAPTWEAALAEALLRGESPSQALLTVENWWTQKDENNADQQALTGISWDNIKDSVASTASAWHTELIKDYDPISEQQPGEGLKVLRDLGIPDPGTQFSGVDVNSQLAPAADKYAKLRDQASAADANVVMDTPVGSAGSSSAARHRQRAKRKGVVSDAPKITRIDPNSSAADRKNRLDSIAARDTAGLDLRRQSGRADLMLNKLQELGVDPSRLAAQRVLGQIQGLASGVYGY
jgi:hypothetical protein